MEDHYFKLKRGRQRTVNYSNLNPYEKNLFTANELNAFNHRTKNNLKIITRGFENEKRCINAAHAKEEIALHRVLAQLNQGKERSFTSQDSGINHLIVQSVPNFVSKKSSLDVTSPRNAQLTNLARLSDRRSSLPIVFDRNLTQRSTDIDGIDAIKLEGGHSSKWVSSVSTKRRESGAGSTISRINSPRESRRTLTTADDGDVNQRRSSVDFRAMNVRLKANRDLFFKGPRQSNVRRKSSLFETQDINVVDRKEKALKEESYDAKFAKETLNTRYLRLTKSNVDALEKTCRRYGINVGTHPHLDEEQIKSKLHQVFEVK